MTTMTARKPAHRAAIIRRTTTSTGARSWNKATATLWTVQGLLALVFIFAGASKLFMSAEALTEGTSLSAPFLRFIGVAEFLGGVGLVLPGLLKIRTGLAPLAAAGLVIIMVGATVITASAGDVGPALIPFTIGVLAATVAYYRGIAPHRSPSAAVAGLPGR